MTEECVGWSGIEKSNLTNHSKHGADRTLKVVKQEGVLVTDNERYTIYDLHLNELTVSMTELKSMQETRGHGHMDASEVYFFTNGRGKMQIGEQDYIVEKGSVMLVPRGEFHKVINSDNEKLVFVTVFEGSRASKKYNYSDK